MKIKLRMFFILTALSLTGCGSAPDSTCNNPGSIQFDITGAIVLHARAAAERFSYYATILPDAGNFYEGADEIEGQCGDYALAFALSWNEAYPDKRAKLVTVNNEPFARSGAYAIVGRRNDFDYSSWWPYPVSGFAIYEWNSDTVFGLYHPELGFYELEQTEEYTVRRHFGVDMTDKAQIHTWAKIGDIAVDPCYADLFDTPFVGEDL